jgi:hypothetical protein
LQRNLCNKSGTAARVLKIGKDTDR